MSSTPLEFPSNAKTWNLFIFHMGHGRSSYPLSSSYPSHYSRRIMNTSYNSATPISSMQLMPSKSISRSSSKPNLSKTGIAHSPHSKPIPSNYSSCSARSSKSSSWVSKIGRLIGKKSLSSRHNSDLTEDNLEAHNRRTDILNQNYSNSSPYYTGVFTNPPLKLAHPGSSPRPKSHATTVSTSSSLSSFLDKVREFGSCFSPKKGNSSNNKPASYATISSSLSRIPKASLYKEMNIEEKKKISEKALLIEEGKPLRERVPEPTPTPTLALPSNEDQVINEKDMNEKVNEMSEFVWANKYRPKALEDFICNRDKAIELRSLMRQGGCGHVIFEGPRGVGKRTMIWAMLRDAFGPERIQAREECKAFKLKGETEGKIEVNILQSPQHVEVNLSELKGYEKHVIVELMKETRNMISNKAVPCGPDNCQAIILYEVDKLSTDALLYMGWLLERYKGCNKVFFCCSDVTKLQPIKAICTVVKHLPPTNEEIIEVLQFIAKQEGIELPLQLAEKITEKSKNNLRQAIRSFEGSWKNNYPFKEDQVILTGWEDDIANIAKKIVEEQSPKQLYIIRGKLQKLIDHDVSPDFIFESLVGELKKLVRVELHQKLDTLYWDYSRANNKGMHEEMDKGLPEPLSKNVQRFLRIEEFIAKFMSCYKSSLTTDRGIQHESAT